MLQTDLVGDFTAGIVAGNQLLLTDNSCRQQLMTAPAVSCRLLELLWLDSHHPANGPVSLFSIDSGIGMDFPYYSLFTCESSI